MIFFFPSVLFPFCIFFPSIFSILFSYCIFLHLLPCIIFLLYFFFPSIFNFSLIFPAIYFLLLFNFNIFPSTIFPFIFFFLLSLRFIFVFTFISFNISELNCRETDKVMISKWILGRNVFSVHATSTTCGGRLGICKLEEIFLNLNCEETFNQGKYIFPICQIILTECAITKSYSRHLGRLIHSVGKFYAPTPLPTQLIFMKSKCFFLVFVLLPTIR